MNMNVKKRFTTETSFDFAQDRLRHGESLGLTMHT
jgi:hypothetical protein